MKDKKVQIVINIVVVINIMLIIMVGYYLLIKSKYTVKYIKQLAEKNSQCFNYIIETKEENIETKEKYHTKIFQKENERREDIISENITRWYANDIQMFEDRNNRVYSKSNTEQSITNLSLEMNWGMYGDNENFKYMGKEKYNNTNCIILYYEDVERFGSGGVWTILDHKIWIDEKLGYILKQETYNESKLIKIKTYTIQTNCVTDKEIELPEIKEFEEYKMESFIS